MCVVSECSGIAAGSPETPQWDDDSLAVPDRLERHKGTLQVSLLSIRVTTVVRAVAQLAVSFLHGCEDMSTHRCPF